MTCTVWQLEGKKATQINEICLGTPQNRTENVCRELIRQYTGHDAGMFIYGDPAGKHEDTRTEKGYNDFVIIIRALAIFKPSLRVANSAPPVVMRGNFINAVFAHNQQGLEFVIGENCAKSISDYMYLKEAADGTKAKIKEKNQETGVSYEKYGHTSDANDYLLCYAFASEFTMYQKGGVSRPITVGSNNVSKNSY
jgi:hypothetical protein